MLFDYIQYSNIPLPILKVYTFQGDKGISPVHLDIITANYNPIWSSSFGGFELTHDGRRRMTIAQQPQILHRLFCLTVFK